MPEGVECWRCGGDASIDDEQCSLCHGEGVLSFELDEVDRAEKSVIHREYIEAIYAARECPRLPNEWLSQPWLFVRANAMVAPYLAEFRERSKPSEGGADG